MKNYWKNLLGLGMIFCLILPASNALLAQENDLASIEDNQEYKKNFEPSLIISGGFVNASLETAISFQGPGGFLTAKIGLEDNLGLTKSKGFFSGELLWRWTYRSGLYFNMYSIYRRKTFSVNEEFPFLNDVVPAGTSYDLHFNTNVYSIGYMYTVVSDAKSFLGAYANIYLMNISTGIRTSGERVDGKVKFLAPLPNFGLMLNFQVLKWMKLQGRFGMFYLKIDDFTGKMNDVSISSNFSINHWLGVNLGYKIFDVSVLIFQENVKTKLEYNFRGPSLGLTIKL